MIKIKVTQEHIDAASPGGSLCPIDRAARELFPEAKTGLTFLFPEYQVVADEKLDRYPLPEEARLFVRAFDSHLEVGPFEFELDETQMLKGVEA